VGRAVQRGPAPYERRRSYFLREARLSATPIARCSIALASLRWKGSDATGWREHVHFRNTRKRHSCKCRGLGRSPMRVLAVLVVLWLVSPAQAEGPRYLFDCVTTWQDDLIADKIKGVRVAMEFVQEKNWAVPLQLSQFHAYQRSTTASRSKAWCAMAPSIGYSASTRQALGTSKRSRRGVASDPGLLRRAALRRSARLARQWRARSEATRGRFFAVSVRCPNHFDGRIASKRTSAINPVRETTLLSGRGL
jgi:hypothetical protein